MPYLSIGLFFSPFLPHLLPFSIPLAVLLPSRLVFCPVFDLNVYKVIQQVMMSESREEAVSAAVSLLYTGSCSLSKVSSTH